MTLLNKIQAKEKKITVIPPDLLFSWLISYIPKDKLFKNTNKVKIVKIISTKILSIVI